jgi:hypothetical protein
VKIILYRVAQFGGEGTVGIADLDRFRQVWLELPDRDNQPRLSRVNAGTYRLVPHLEGRFAPTWALEGDGVAPAWAPGVKRSAILIHAGNRAADSRGCPLPGRRLGFLGGDLAVLESRRAMAELRDTLSLEEEHELEIIDLPGGWEAGR